MIKRFNIKIRETIATLIADEKYLQLTIDEIKKRRNDIESYIICDPIFSTILEPYNVSDDAPEIVRRMASASEIAGVGPMAAVAGAIAFFVIKAIKEAGGNFAIFDNGGDIALYINKPIVVGVYSGYRGYNLLGFIFQPREDIFGICTSSASVGYSISFGKTDATTIIAQDVILADAVATALGNEITTKDSTHIINCMKKKMIEGIEGIVTIFENKIGFCGSLPRIVKVNINADIITKGC